MSEIKQKIQELAEIIKEDCVLVIGPNAYLCDTPNGEKSLFELLSQNLIAEVPDLQPIANSNDFHLLASEFARTKSDVALKLKVKEFYKNVQSNFSMLETLARLPFSLIINTTPDDLLLQVFQKMGKLQTQTAFYHYKKQDQNEKIEGTVDKPLIYNFLGKLEERNSLVLTHEDQLSFVKNIISEDAGLPKQLLATLKEKTHYIFIGFDFEYWYLRLMFQTLNLDKYKNEAMAFQANNQPLRTPTKIFFNHEYKMEFVEETPELFLQLLSDAVNGSKTPSQNNATTGQAIYVLYHQNDAEMFDKFKTSIAFILKKNNMQLLDNQSFEGGETQLVQEKNIAAATLILPLISSRFLADNVGVISLLDYAAKQANKKIVPILLKPCSFDMIEDSYTFHSVLPAKEEFISQKSDLDTAFRTIATQIEIILKTLAA